MIVHPATLVEPDVNLDSRAVATLSMAFHELATNAAKYGALSSREGRVEVSWRVDGNAKEEHVEISRHESKGPAITGSQEDGFGANFVKRSIAYELNGTVEMSYEPSGFKAEIAFPLQGNSRGARS